MSAETSAQTALPPTATGAVHEAPRESPPVDRQPDPVVVPDRVVVPAPVVVPEWARAAPLTAMPYPEGGAYDPPLPPVQIPSWMLPDGGGPDAY